VKKLLFILLLVFVLRIPSFFEPYWYGDEGIYLAVGQALQRGAVLYRDIWDNKTPLLYLIYAIFPTLIWAKLTATICVLGTITALYSISKKFLTANPDSIEANCSLLTAFLTGVLMSLPYPILEGYIANAELYFTLPIILGGLLFWKLIDKKVGPTRYLITFLAVGLLLTTAFLLKVPAVFDFVGMLFAIYIFALAEIKLSIGNIVRQTFLFAKNVLLPIFIPFIITCSCVVLYFYFNHALSDFTIASFSQNASYVAIDSGPFSKLTNPLFVKGIILIAFCFLLSYFYFRQKVSKELLFLSLWFGFSLYGALLSNRPYPHYLLQIVPPAIILEFYLLTNFRKFIILNSLFIILLLLTAKPFLGNFDIKNFNYYQNWFDYISERKTWVDYVNNFDSKTSNNYELANYLATRTQPLEPIFVWSDNAFIYVLSHRPPATKFIQAHHLTTIDPKNYNDSINRLIATKPKFIIVSHPVRFPFPKLEELLKKNYHFVEKFEDLFVYQHLKI